MRKLFTIALAIVGLLFAVACEPDNNGGKHESELPVNSYSISGEATKLHSVAVDMVGDNIYVVATPAPNLTTAEAIFASEEYIFVAVNPLLVGVQFDLKTESQLYTIMSTLSGAPLKEVTPDNNGEVLAGMAQLSYEGGVVDVKADITLKNGKVLSLHLSAEKSIVVNENVIARGDEQKPLRAAFYDEGDYATTLYFTPAGLEHFGEIEDASWYIYLGVSNQLIDGATHLLDEMGGTSMFEFGVIDNMYSSKSVEIMAGYLRGATGDFTITKSAEARYTATINIELLGVQYVVRFDDECISVDYAPEAQSNYFIYNGNESVATDAVLTKGESVWSVEVSSSNGISAIVNAPQSFFEQGGTYGFSQSQLFNVVCDGVTYSKANGDMGTVTLLYDGQNQTITIDFTNYDNLQFNYSGGVVVE